MFLFYFFNYSNYNKNILELDIIITDLFNLNCLKEN